jgi:hypothetical protein
MKGRGPALFCLLAGGGEVATGLSLVAAPDLALRLLGMPSPAGAGGDLVLLRFVGVFVACVGLAYLYPWLSSPPIERGARRAVRLVPALEMTAGVRLAVALFLGIAVATGRLALPWVAVGAYDALLGAAQLALLAKGFFGRAA